MESTVKQRLIEYLKFKKISKTEFGRQIGVSSAFVTSMRTSIQPDKIKSIAIKFPDLNTSWLLTGEGEMLKTGKSQIEQPSSSLNKEDRLFTMLESQQRTAESQQQSINELVISVKELVSTNSTHMKNNQDLTERILSLVESQKGDVEDVRGVAKKVASV